MFVQITDLVQKVAQSRGHLKPQDLELWYLVYSICQWTSTKLLQICPYDQKSHIHNNLYINAYMDQCMQKSLICYMYYHLVDLNQVY